MLRTMFEGKRYLGVFILLVGVLVGGYFVRANLVASVSPDESVEDVSRSVAAGVSEGTAENSNQIPDQAILELQNPSAGIAIELTVDDLLAMPQVTVNTSNDFVDDVSEFSGPLARDVISMLGDDIEMARFYAINGYSIEIPVSDFRDYDVIFALSVDGNLFSLRDKGPVWLIYPMTDNPELQDRVYNDRLIWLLTRVTAL